MKRLLVAGAILLSVPAVWAASPKASSSNVSILPGGNANIAVGADYRYESIDNPSARTAA